MSDANITSLKVEGMTCANCARSVENVLKKNGAQDVYVDFLNDEVTYTDAGKVGEETIKSVIEGIGYHIPHDDGHSHDHHGHNHDGVLWKLAISLALAIPLLIFHFFHFVDAEWTNIFKNHWVQFGMALPVFLIGAWHFGGSAFGALKHKEINMDVLIFIGGTAAFIYSIVGLIQANDNMIFFETSATIFAFVLLGNYIEERASKGTTSAIDGLKEMQNMNADRQTADGSWQSIKAGDLQLGDTIRVNEGQSIPADGVVKTGSIALNLALITGESEPQSFKIGDQVVSGAVVTDGNCEITVRKVGTESTLGRIIQLVKKAQSEKPGIQRYADRISAIFVPTVLTISILAFGLNYWIWGVGMQESILRSIAVLVISCPCAMGLATPTAVAVGLGRLSRSGILMKGANTIERLASIKTFIFDKTGTLTTGEFQVKSFDPINEESSIIADIITQIESRSSHPIAKSLVTYFKGKGKSAVRITEVNEVAGEGIYGKDAQDNTYFIGSDTESNEGHLVLKKNELIIARFSIYDELKDHAADLVKWIKADDKEVILLSGDNEHKTSEIAHHLDFDNYYAGQKPDQKLSIVERIGEKSPVAMIGDGINDAAALTRADIGISMGDATSVSIQAADIVLLNSSLDKLKEALGVSKLTLTTIKQNLFWAFGYNIIAIPLAVVGLVSPMWAALFMGMSDVVIIGNSLWLKRKLYK